MSRFLVSVALLLAIGSGCAQEPTDATPDGTLQLFLVAMDRSGFDAEAREDAYHLLCEEARQRLGRRAERATALARRDFQPWEMLAQGRYRLRFSARPEDGISAEIDGDRATVVVRGRSGQEARVPMRREEGRWCIHLDIPLLEHAGTRVPRAPAE